MREEPINKDVSGIDRILYVICTIICICTIIGIGMLFTHLALDEDFKIILTIIALVIFIVTSLSIFERYVKKNRNLANILIRVLTVIVLLIIIAITYLLYTSARDLVPKALIEVVECGGTEQE